MDGARTAGPASRRGRRDVVGLAVLIVIASSIGAWFFVRGPQIPPQADPVLHEDVLAAAERFAAGVNTYDVADLDPYVERVRPMLTDELAAQFQVSAEDLLARFARSGIVSRGAVEQIAIDDIDADRARVVAAIAVTTVPAQADGHLALRWRIALVRDGDDWLVDNFVNLAAAPAPTGGGQ